MKHNKVYATRRKREIRYFFVLAQRIFFERKGPQTAYIAIGLHPSADRIQKLTDHHPTEEKISPSPSLPAISYFIPGTVGLGSALEVEGTEGRERGIKHNGYNNGQEGGTRDDGGRKGKEEEGQLSMLSPSRDQCRPSIAAGGAFLSF